MRYFNPKITGLVFLFLMSLVLFSSSTSARMIRGRSIFYDIKPTMLKLLEDENPFVKIIAAKYLIGLDDEDSSITMEKLKELLFSYEGDNRDYILLEGARVFADLGKLDSKEGEFILDNLTSSDKNDILLELAKLLLTTEKIPYIKLGRDLLKGLVESQDTVISRRASFLATDYEKRERMEKLIANVFIDGADDRIVSVYVREMIKSLYYPGELKKLVEFLEKVPFSSGIPEEVRDNLHFALVSILNEVYIDKPVLGDSNHIPFCFEWAMDFLVELAKNGNLDYAFPEYTYRTIRKWGEYFLLEHWDVNNSRFRDIFEQFITEENMRVPISLLGHLNVRDKAVNILVEYIPQVINSTDVRDRFKRMLIEALTYWGIGSEKVKQALEDFAEQTEDTNPDLSRFIMLMKQLLGVNESACEESVKDVMRGVVEGTSISENELNYVAGLWVIYGFKKAHSLLWMVVTDSNQNIDIKTEVKAMHYLSLRKGVQKQEEITRKLFLDSLHSGKEKIYKEAVSDLTQEQWIDDSEVRQELGFALNDDRIDYGTKLNIARALIVHGSEKNREIAIKFLLDLASNESLQGDLTKYRSTAIEILNLELDLK